MNRRHFLRSGSYAALLAAGLPAKARRKSQNTPHIYKNEWENGKADQTLFTLTLYHTTVEKPALAKPEEKLIGLTARHFTNGNSSAATTSAEFKYLAESSEQTDKANNIWRVKTTLEQKVSGDYSLPDVFPKDLRVLIKPLSYAELLSAKGKSLVRLPFYSAYTASGDEDCFLTTACVHHRRLPDDCDELQTLRLLRDNYMRHRHEGRQLVAQYHTTGPLLVQAINEYENSHAIYEYMYTNMICPAVQLVKEGKQEEAVRYYTVFVKALVEKYVG